MFLRRDFDLNSTEVYSDSANEYPDPSLKEVFRKTMVSQEIVFQTQVLELHRIYGTQRSLMEFDRFNSMNRNIIGSTLSKSQMFFEGCQQRPFDQPDNLKLSLSIIGDKNKTRKRTWFDVNLACDVIDLDDSTETASNDDNDIVGQEHSSLPSKNESQKSVVTDEHHERTWFDREMFDLNVFSEDLSSKKEQTSSFVMLDLDLNKAYCDDSSCHSNDMLTINPSRASSSQNLSDEASGTSHPNDARNCSPASSKDNDEIADASVDKIIDPKENESVEFVAEILTNETQVCQDSKEEIRDNESSNERTVLSDSDEFDVLIREAAESLIHIAFVIPDCFRDSNEENKEIETPQSSMDSFERFTLGLKECTEDDLCVSSKPWCEPDVAEKKEYGLKIRRGRRLKDFQRDILPGMASLSRHEIREDVNILEGVLRSREYKKMQAQMADKGHSWCVPTRSRRSRLSCSKRRRFS